MYQLDVNGNIIVDRETDGPNRERILDLIYTSLNNGVYKFEWNNNERQPYKGILYSLCNEVHLYIYVWRISNGGRQRPSEKRIQISTNVSNIGFNAPIDETHKTLLLGVYEHIHGYPVFAAWDVRANRQHGSSKSCFVQIEDLKEAFQKGFVITTDSHGNRIYTFTKDFLIDYILGINEDGVIELSNNSGNIKNDVKKTTIDKTVSQFENSINNITDTERNALIKGRIGQHQFRALLLHKYNQECCICKLKYDNLLVASHIQPWAVSNNNERLDINNGLLLCVIHDALFDKFLISFEDSGQILISDSIKNSDYNLLNLSEHITINISAEQIPYIRWHRNMFRSQN